jgi:DNA repair ATPase RecN
MLLALAVMAAGGCSSETKNDRPEVKQPNSPAATGAVQKAASSLQAWSKDGSELKTKLTAAYDDLSAALQEIKDSETAQAAVTRLRASDKSLGELVQMAEKLPAAAKPVVAAFANKGAEKLKALISELERKEDVGDTLKPVLDAIREKLERFPGSQADRQPISGNRRSPT